MRQLVRTEDPSPGLRVLTLDRPEARNALSRALIAGIGGALRAAAEDPEVRCVVMSGGKNQFSAGADIKEFIAEGYAVLDDPQRKHDWQSIEDFPKPLVAAVEGYAFGGGFELMLLADIAVAAEDARFAFPEINIGVIPGDGGTQRATRVAGKALTLRMMLTGEPIDAATALRAGLISELARPGESLSQALAIARRIAEKSPIALRLAKEAVLAAHRSTLDLGLDVERAAVARAFATEDRLEGMRAFAERRPPRFSGR